MVSLDPLIKSSDSTKDEEALARVLVALQKSGKKVLQIPIFVRIAVAFLIVFQAFYPLTVWQFSIAFLAVLIVVIVIVAIVAYFSAGAALASLNIIMDIVVPLAILVILSFLIQLIGSPNYYRKLGMEYGSLMANLAFVGAVVLLSALFFIAKSPISFIILAIILILIVFVAIPLVYGQMNNREVHVDALQTVNVPVVGGIEMKFGTAETDYQPPATLYAGEPYDFAFILTNYYEQPITFELAPSLISNYGQIEFTQKFDQKKTSLVAKEYYQDSILMDPKLMKIKESSNCSFNSLQISRAQGVPPQNVTCANDKPCEDPSYTCARIGSFNCDCADWTKATCTKEDVKIKMGVKHTGFFRGIANLSYTQDMAPPEKGFEFTQGPLAVIIEFQPNPYISEIHKDRENVTMRLTFRNRGGDITIKSFNVTPQNTVIHTREGNMELVEEVGTQIRSCRDINDLLPGGLLVNGAEIGGRFCDLTPPLVKTTLRNLDTNEVVEMNGVTLDKIYYYCNKIKPSQDQGNSSDIWSTKWNQIYDNIKESGFCEIMNKKDNPENQNIQRSLAYTQVVVEFSYDRDATFLSGRISPITRTEECENLAKSTS